MGVEWVPAPRMPSEFGEMAKAWIPTMPRRPPLIWPTISCCDRARSPHGASVITMKPRLSLPVPAMEKTFVTSPEATMGATTSSISRSFPAVYSMGTPWGARTDRSATARSSGGVSSVCRPAATNRAVAPTRPAPVRTTSGSASATRSDAA